MSATAARQILSYNRDLDLVTVQVEGDTFKDVPLDQLKRAELLRTAKVVFPETSGKAWFKATSETILRAVRSGVAPAILGATKASSAKGYPNRYAGTCGGCGIHVDPKAGWAVKADTGKWIVECKLCVPFAAATSVREEATGAKVSHRRPVEPEEGAFTPEVEKLKALAEALKAFTPEVAAPTVDEATVRRLVEELLDKVPARRVEVIVAEQVRPLPDAHHERLPLVIQVLGSGVRNVFLVGPAGSGKSTLAEHAAAALGREVRALSFGPTTPTSKLFGYCDAHGNYVSTPFREAYEHGHVFVGDELDNGHPGLVAELNQALANGYAAFADTVVKAHPDFRFVGTGNTFGKGPDRLFVGRNILDAATLDRFVTIEVDVDTRLERALATALVPEGDSALEKTVATWVDHVQAVRTRVETSKVPLIVSPRATIEGARLLVAGVDRGTVEAIRLTAGWSSEHREKAGV